MSTRPGKTNGLRHVALYVSEFDACERFYTELLGMEVEWRPDEDNLYLSSGNDNGWPKFFTTICSSFWLQPK